MSRRDRDPEISTSKREEGWISKTFRTSEAGILTQCGLDTYSFIRFLRLILQLYLAIAIVIIPVLLPLNFIDGKGSFQGIQGLDRLNIANIGERSSRFYWAHFVLSTTSILPLLFYYQLRGSFVHKSPIYLSIVGT